ncbi:MAG: RNA polymerase sigma factor [Paludibacteraceae bacterium]
MSDEQLIQIILSGNKEAFTTLLKKYQLSVFRTAMGFVHSKEDAEDIVQDVFIQVYRTLSSFKGSSQFSTWLYRITLNTSINFINKNKWRNLFTDSGESLKNLFNRSNEEKNAHQNLEAEERDVLILKAIEQLPEKQRMAFVLSKYEELSQKEIAGIMQITEGAVEQLLQRAKQFLRKKLIMFVGN